jgi:MoxR-like ATPase
VHVQENIARLRKEVERVLVGQEALLDGLLVALLCSGHVLVEGVPGLAKTTAVKTFARALGLGFRRLQFTPDLLPADLLGTQIYDPQRGEFRLNRGPIFHQVVLADEINRAPAKVQSALLEAMEERQVTLAGQTLALPRPFLVMATQNPVEQEGVYPLPEAQVDRFMLKLRVDYPSPAEELRVVERRISAELSTEIAPVLDAEQLPALQRAAADVHVERSLAEYAIALVTASRTRERLRLGGSPRASIYLVEGSRARAFLQGRDYVLPEDVKAIAPDVLRHRLLLRYDAEADGVTVESEIAALLASVPTP